MKKSSIVLISGVAVMLVLKIAFIFELRSMVDDNVNELIDKAKEQEKQEIVSPVKTLVLQDSTHALLEQDNTNWIKHYGNLSSQIYEDDSLVIRKGNRVSLSFNDLTHMVLTDNSNLEVATPMSFDTLWITASQSSELYFSNIKAKHVKIECLNDARIKLRNVEIDHLSIWALNNSSVNIRGKIGSINGAAKDESYVISSSARKSNFSTDESAVFSTY